MLRARSVAICAALYVTATATATTVSTRASAQQSAAARAVEQAPPPPESNILLRLRSMHGWSREVRPDASTDDWSYLLTPEILALHVEPRWQARASYAVTGALHSALPDEVAHRGAAGLSGELSRRTTASLGVEGGYQRVSNILVAGPAYLTPVSAVPLTETRVLTGSAAETLSWEASPVVRVDQRLEGTYVVLDQPTGKVKTALGNFILGFERSWQNDGLGVEGRAGVSDTRGATLLVNNRLVPVDQTVFPLTAAPRWRHDYSRALSSLLSAGATVLVSPDADTKPILAPTGRAALLYDWQTAHVEASYSYGFEPNLLTAQLLRAHNATLMGTMPLSQPDHVAANATIGYQRGQFVNLRTDIPNPPDFGVARADVELTWAVRLNLQVLVRYQFLWQTSEAVNGIDGTYFRHAVLAGIQLTSAGPTLNAALSRSPQRVDRRDAAP